MNLPKKLSLRTFQISNLSRFNYSSSSINLKEEKVLVDGINLNYAQAGNGPHTVLCLPGVLGHKKYSILGWSAGGVTGGFIGSEYPEKVSKLVTWGTACWVDERLLTFCQMMGNLDSWSEQAKGPMFELYGEKYLQKMLTEWAKAMEDMHRRRVEYSQDFVQRAQRIQADCLVIHGGKDPMVGPEHAECLVKHLKNSSLHVIPEGKHNLHLRFTDEFLNVVEKFLIS